MKKRVVTGYRPTGNLHLGHLEGVIKKMMELQEKYECFFFIADWHALTTEYRDPSIIKQSTVNMIIDWLAAGISPEKATIYRQSDIPEVSELNLYYGMITPLGWLERNPTYKEQLRELSSRHIQTYGFLGYPVLQAADILIVKGEIVPVGEDQVPHLELTREIARRFNSLYRQYFPEPKAMLSKLARIPGTDGRKMSKSFENAIYLSDTSNTIRKKVKGMFTDPKRVYRKDPGHPDKCPVFTLHGLYSSKDRTKQIKELCLNAKIGCTDCKDELAERIVSYLEPISKRRKEIEKNPEIVKKVLEKGAKKVKSISKDVIVDVRNLLGLS